MGMRVPHWMRGVRPILMHVRMRVQHRPMLMPMRVEISLPPAHQQADGQRDDHHANQRFRSALHELRQDTAEQDDGEAEQEQRDSVAEAPEEPEQAGAPPAAVVVRQDQRGNGGEMVRIGRMPRAEQQRDDEGEAEAAPAKSAIQWSRLVTCECALGRRRGKWR